MSLPLNLDRLISLERWFSLNPTIGLSTVYFLLAFFGALILIGLIIEVARRSKKRENFSNKLLYDYFSCLTAMGVVGLVWVWFRYERVFILSARFWFLLWLVALMVWLVFILKYQLKVVPQAKKHLAEKQVFNKYLPGRKK